MMLELTTHLVRKPDLTTAELDGEVVMLNLEQNRYYGLNLVGSRIWELWAQPLTIQQVCDTLQREFDVAPAECEREVTALAQQLLDAKLIMTVS